MEVIKNKKKLILLIVLVIIGIIIYLFWPVLYFLIKYRNFKFINPDISISVSQNIVVDSDYLIERKYIDANLGEFFHDIEDKDFQKLIKYMTENNLQIEPGKYIVKPDTNFEDILKTVKFKKMNK